MRNRRVLSADLLALRRDDDTPLADRREREHARLVGEHLGRKLGRLDRSDEARAELEAFDTIENPPADMVALIDQFGLRDALG